MPSRSLVPLAALVAAACHGPPRPIPPPASSAPPAMRTTAVDRAAFQRALAKVQPGMTAAQVIALVGRPDDIRTERDPDGLAAARTVEVWRWGTDGHLGFGTLGTVHLQTDHTVQYVFGGAGAPPPATVIDEATLRDTLRALDRVPSYQEPADPRATIAAVNALVALGHDRALAAIGEYLRVSSPFDDPGRDGLFVVLAALFEVPEPPGYQPAPALGASQPPPPTNPRALPRFPVALVDDVPLVVVHGYSLAGEAEPPEWHLAALARSGVMRTAPLRPPADPLALFDRLAGHAGTAFLRATSLDDRAGRALILDQGLRLVATASPLAADADGGYLPPDVAIDAAWTHARAAVAARAIHWDAGAARYAFADGSTTPPPPPRPPRQLWDAPLPGASPCRLILARRTADVVDVEVRIERAPGAANPAATLRVLDGADVLASMPILAGASPPGSTSGMVLSRRVRLPAGRALHAELDVGGSLTRGPEVVP